MNSRTLRKKSSKETHLFIEKMKGNYSYFSIIYFHIFYFHFFTYCIHLFLVQNTMDIDEENLVQELEITEECFPENKLEEINESIDDEPASNMETKEIGLAHKLLIFFIMFNISHRAMKFLLNILIDEGLNVPPSVYLLKKNLNTNKYKIVQSSLSCGGKFAYLSIYESIKHFLESNILRLSNIHNELDVHINIDGLPLFKSSAATLWPILIRLPKTNLCKPFPIAVYTGVQKPDLCGFIRQLHDEILLFQDYVSFQGIFVKFKRVLFICDSPAKAFVQGVKLYSGYNSCQYCKIPGFHNGKKIIFPFNVDGFENRTDESYANFCEDNQQFKSMLASILPLRNAFPLDYMHLVCLGIVKRLMQSYFSNIHGHLSCRLYSGNLKLVNERATFYKNVLPKEFDRKIRTFKDLSFFKASEYRTLILYTGPVLFRNILPDEYYNHFTLLHFSIYVFVSNSYNHLFINAKNCIDHFLSQLGRLFTDSAYTYNAHCLSHLHEFVQMYGSLENYSAFPYESYLSVLKKRIKTGSFILTQSVNSLISLRSIYNNLPSKLVSFSTTSPDNCAIIQYNGKHIPIIIDNIFEDKVSGYVMKFFDDIYTYPYLSRVLGIGFYNTTSLYVNNVKPVNKCIIFPKGAHKIVIPFANFDSNYSC